MGKRKDKKNRKQQVTEGFRLDAYNGVDKINRHMYVAGDPVYCGRNHIADQMLVAEKVDVIIDCRSLDERRDGWDEEGLAIPVIYAPMHDDGYGRNNAGDFITPYLQVQELIGRGVLPNNPVFLVHCHMGVNRGPSMAMFLMMMEHGYSAKEAFLRIRDRRAGTGLAYAEQAVKAHMELSNGDPEDVDDFLRFEDAYWTTARKNTVNNRIHRNRQMFNGLKVMIDDRGIAHGIR